MIRCFLLLAALASFASAADPATAKRDRDAAAVLALEMELAKKPAKLLTYSEAVTAATADGRPLIAYPASVRHPSCPPGAVCAVSEDNQIIIGYPSNGGITIVERLPPDASDADVLRAFKKAKARGGPVAGEDGKDPFFISLTLPLAIAAPPACSCSGKLPCECGESCRCVAAHSDASSIIRGAAKDQTEVQMIQFAQPCPGGVCPAPAKPATAPMPMVGPGPVVKTVVRPVQRTRGLVVRLLFPWRR